MRRLLAALLFSLLASLSIGCSDPPKTWKPVPAAPKGAGSTSLESYSVKHIEYPASVFALGFVDAAFGGLFALAVILSVVHRRRARAAAAFNPTAPLVQGPFVLAGVVEIEPGTPGAPVAVEIDQTGTEHSTKNGYSHRWTESSRRVTALPFSVRREDGLVVRVIPDDRVALHDSLSRIVPRGYAKRTRIAELTAGEKVHVTGLLTVPSPGAQGVYRGTMSTPTLTPSGRMVISTEPPGDTESERAGLHRGYAIFFAIAWAFFGIFGLGDAHLFAVDSVTVRATPTEVGTWKVWVKPKNSTGHWVHHYAVRAAFAPKSGRAMVLEDECSYEAYQCVTEGRCATVPFTMVSGVPSMYRIGADFEVGRNWIYGSVTLWIIVTLLYWGFTVSTRPWYMSGKVEDMGSGRLPKG